MPTLGVDDRGDAHGRGRDATGGGLGQIGDDREQRVVGTPLRARGTHILDQDLTRQVGKNAVTLRSAEVHGKHTASTAIEPQFRRGTTTAGCGLRLDIDEIGFREARDDSAHTRGGQAQARATELLDEPSCSRT